jgi:drug/metabolite transporter (DMT)-like permease
LSSPATTSRSADAGFGPTETAMLVGLASMWGGSFLFIEVALRGMTPLWIVTGRCLVGGLVLLLVLRVRRRPLPGTRQLWGRLLLLGAMSNALPWGAIAWAQQSLPSGLTALLMALVPSSTLIVAVSLRQERFTPTRLLGLLLALGGVGLTVVDDLGNPDRVVAILAVVGATMLYACGAVYAKGRVSGQAGPLAIATGQVLAASVLALPAALLFEPLPSVASFEPLVVASVLALGALGTGFAFLLFYMLIERVGATNTTMVTYLIPIVAVIAGAVLLGERLGWASLSGGALIGLGIWVAQRSSAARARQHLEEPHP